MNHELQSVLSSARVFLAEFAAAGNVHAPRLVRRIDALLERTNTQEDRLRDELLRVRGSYERAIEYLTRIHAVMNPPDVKANGKTYRFENPHANECLQALSDAIRAIPAELRTPLPSEPTRAMLDAWSDAMRGHATHQASTLWPGLHYSDSESRMVKAYQAMLEAAPRSR